MLFCRNQDFATASAEMMISKDNRIRYNNSAESSSYQRSRAIISSVTNDDQPTRNIHKNERKHSFF
jgi:hypothetical protein